MIPDAHEAAEPRAISAERIHGAGLFEARLSSAGEGAGAAAPRYRVLVDGTEREDPYRLPPVRDEASLARLREPGGRVHEVLGAHPMHHDDVGGTVFAVWAPTARAISLVGSFNGWNAVAHPMRSRDFEYLLIKIDEERRLRV